MDLVTFPFVSLELPIPTVRHLAMEGILIVNYPTETYSRYWWDACTAPFGRQYDSFFSNHMGQALNSIRDKMGSYGETKGKVPRSMETSSQITFN